MKNTVERAMALSFLLLALAGAGTAQTEQPSPSAGNAAPSGDAAASTAARAHNNDYVIGDDDLLEINVWKDQELSKTVPVRSDGKISLPLVGEVQAAGRTPLQLEGDITSRLRSFMNDPEVTVIVAKINSQKFNVMGEVNRPGSYPLSITTTVMDAIATAGGFRDFAKKKDVIVLRQNPNGTESRFTFNWDAYIKGKNPQRNIRLQPGDTVVVR